MCVITHLEPDILECEVQWALGSITVNKASGGDGIPDELFQVLKDGAATALHSMAADVETQSGHGTGRGQRSLQSQRRAVPKSAQTTAQLHACHIPAK